MKFFLMVAVFARVEREIKVLYVRRKRSVNLQKFIPTYTGGGTFVLSGGAISYSLILQFPYNLDTNKTILF